MLERLSYELYIIFERIAKDNSKDIISSKDILIEIVNDEFGYFDYILNEYKTTKENVIKIINSIKDIEHKSNEYFLNKPLSINVLNIYNKSVQIANKDKSEYIYIEHIIYAMLDEATSISYKALNCFIYDMKKLKQEYNDVYEYEGTCDSLVNITKEVDEFDHIVSRDLEIKKIIEGLNRYKKKNVLLVGDCGVGKTELAYEVARIYKRNKEEYTFYELKIQALLSNTKYRGDLEYKLSEVIEKITKENVILFIDEIHLLLKSSDNQNDISNYLKPLLVKDICIIGATTQYEYRNYILKDKAFLRRFNKIVVKEPTITETYNILIERKNKYEKYHGITISNKNILNLIKYSNRITMQKFPDKAFDLLDLSMTKCKLKNKKEVTIKEIKEVIYEYLNIKGEKEIKKYIDLKENKVKVIYETNESIDDRLKDIKKTLKLQDEDILYINTESNLDSYNYYLGSTKGYVGYEEGGVFNNFLLKKELEVIVLKYNEITKTIKKILDSIQKGIFYDNKDNEINLINKIFVIVNNQKPQIGF